ncbi:Hypothetical predicted protein, partial [Paramuricea clavata]
MSAVVESSPEITGPQREVVSIYNDDFATPLSTPQYFIEVYRCVKLDFGECSSSGPSTYPVPKRTDEIEIVVPDITNKDSSDKKKFYKYVVHNHTSCQCGNLKYGNGRLYKTIANNEVSEAYFKAKFSKNPVNLIRLCNVCNITQPRYKLHPKHFNVVLPYKYLAYQQCLPGCVVVKNETSNKQTSMLSGSSVGVPLTNDILCKAYDGAKTQQQGKSHPQKLKSSSSEAPVGNSIDQDASNRDPEEMVEATIKFDGSLGIAFLWKDEVMVTSGQQLDSDQAMWAKQWIKDHCNLTEFQAGYTYLFEIIFLNNTVVVNYLFEGLVLLAITDESGHELPYEEVLDCARTIGFFMVTPRITGPYSEVLWYCGGIEHSEESVTPNWPPFTSGDLSVNKKRQEGWVVRFNDGSRQKIVCRWWKNASSLGHLVHPQ